MPPDWDPIAEGAPDEEGAPAGEREDEDRALEDESAGQQDDLAERASERDVPGEVEGAPEGRLPGEGTTPEDVR